MGFLFGKKDKYKILPFIKDLTDLHKFIIKKQKQNSNIDIEDIKYIMDEVKRLYNEAKQIQLNINNDIYTKDKERKQNLDLLNKHFNNLKLTFDKVKKYEKQLSEYKQICKKNETDK